MIPTHRHTRLRITSTFIFGLLAKYNNNNNNNNNTLIRKNSTHSETDTDVSFNYILYTSMSYEAIT